MPGSCEIPWIAFSAPGHSRRWPNADHPKPRRPCAGAISCHRIIDRPPGCVQTRPSRDNFVRRVRCGSEIYVSSARSRLPNLTSEYLRREWDFIVRTTSAGSAARQITTATRAISLGTFAGVGTGEHGHLALEAWQHDLRRVVLLRALVCPLAGLQLAFDINLHALRQESLGDVSDRLVEYYDSVPFRAFLALAGCPVTPGFAGGQREADDLAARLGRADFWVLAQVADQDDLVH